MRLVTETIADVSEQIKTGKTPSTKKNEYFDGNINWYTPSDLSIKTFLNKSIRSITNKAVMDKQAILFDPNTVLITCIGDIGKIGITTDFSSSNQQITGIKLKNKMYPQYFYYWCKRNKKLLESKSRKRIHHTNLLKL